MLGWAGWVFASCWWCSLGLLICNLLWWTGEPCVEHVRGLRCLFEGMGPTRQLHTPKSSELGQYMQDVCIAQGRIGGFGEVVLELRSLSWWYYWCVGSTSGRQTGWFLDIFLEVCVLGYMPIDIVEMPIDIVGNALYHHCQVPFGRLKAYSHAACFHQNLKVQIFFLASDARGQFHMRKCNSVTTDLRR